MQFGQFETPDGINPGAGFRLPGVLGICGHQSTAGTAEEPGSPRTPFDPKSCDHRHQFRRWGSVRKDQGFDDGTLRRSQWQLVPLGETREVELRWDRLVHKQVFSDDPHVASIDRQGGHFVIRGLRTGLTGLHAANSRGICWSELEITVRASKEIPVVFHYIQDNRQMASRSQGSGGKLLERVNEIIAPQTCIGFVELANSVPRFKIDADLGDFVDPHAADVQHWCQERIRKLQTFAAVNVFFVWRVAGVGGDTTGAEMLDNRTCFVGDNAKGDPGRILAHELGHCLTRFDRDDLYHDPEGHTTDKEWLMERFASGTRISREEADVMYETAADSGAT